MANEIPQDSVAADSSGETKQSVWRTEWQWVALAWLGGTLIGGFLMIMAFTSQSDPRGVAVVAGGGMFLAIAPGLLSTLQTWQGHRRSMGKGSIWPWDRVR